MSRNLKLGLVVLAVAVFGLGLLAGDRSAVAKGPAKGSAKGPESDAHKWEALEFDQPIPHAWGTVFSINRVEKGGESYTFWFLAEDGTLRGVTTREFTGPNRASFFPEVYVIRRK